LSLPHGGHREDVIRTKAFEDYIRDHVVSWFNWAQKNRLGVERMEELILVSGCTLVASWAAATLVDNTMESEISLASRPLNNGGASFVWSNIRGPVVYHNSRFDPVSFPGYVYSHALILLCCMESKTHPQIWINVCLSGDSEQSALSSGSDTSVLQQNPFLTTPTTAEKMRYKCHEFQVL
jgi:hypothetical protein